MELKVNIEDAGKKIRSLNMFEERIFLLFLWNIRIVKKSQKTNCEIYVYKIVSPIVNIDKEKSGVYNVFKRIFNTC